MKITTFDLYWNEKTNNHGINTYHDVFFDWIELKFSQKIEKRVSKFELSNILNNSDYKVCHNFYWYDWLKLPSLNNHNNNNIDTLLVDCLISFNKTHHNLKKSINNDPLEDAETTFKVLNKNFKRFHNYSEDLKSILFSLLIEYQEYNDFFIFYNSITWNKLTILSNTEILEKLNKILKKKNISDKISIKLVNNYLESNNDSKLSIAFLSMFINNNTIVLPDFIFKKNIELRKKLRWLLNSFYSHISKNLNSEIKTYLKDFSWFDEFRWVTQIQWVKNTLENNDFLTILSTWGWKSLIYQLPAWIIWNKLWHLTLIITPLKALIKDQIDWLRDKQFNEVNYLSWDQNGIEKDIIYNKIKSWETKILFLTPEALRSEKILDLLQNRYISRIVVDEAHTLILWWQEFRPDYFFIKYFLKDIENKNLNNKINITLLTATATVDVEKWILEYFNERDIKLIKAKEILKENIIWSVINIEKKEDKLGTLISKIKEIDIKNNPTIIFTWRIKSAIEIEKHLKEEWVNIRSFYAWMFLSDKKQVQEDFISWKLNVIVATKAFWMWIDKDNVRYVIHYDLPWNIEDYTQEIWRAWRDWKYSKNIIFYEKKDIEKRIKKLSYSWLRYQNIKFFLQNVKIDNKVILSPRQIAIQSWIKTNKKNWVTDIKILLSFLENEEFNWINILKRKYDNSFVLFNKIENKIVNDCYTLIENDNLLNNEEKRVAKEIIFKIIEEKKAIDLNKLEENFVDDLWEDFEYKKVKINKVTNKIKSFKILSKWPDNEETDIVVEALEVFKKEDFRENIFNIFWKRVRDIDTFKETNDKSSFYNKIKNYYLFKNYITENKWNVLIKDKKKLLEHYNLNSKESKFILDYIYTKNVDFNEKQSINLNELLLHLQKNYKNNYTISELKERLYFLDSLNIIKVKNWLLVFLTRFTIFFDEEIINWLSRFNEKIQTEEFKKELISKLDIYKEIKINKLLALQNIVEILESRWISEYTKLTEYYFRMKLKEFAKEKMINI
jgi:ATP-dependent DNA helicase RecQ